MPEYETQSAQVGSAVTRDDFLTDALDAESPLLSESELAERQAAIGERRRAAGPERDLSATDAPLDEDSYGDEVAHTDVVDPPAAE